MIDLSCIGSHHVIMLEIQYSWDPAMMSVYMFDLSCTGGPSCHHAGYTVYLGSCHDVDMIDLSYARDIPGTLP